MKSLRIVSLLLAGLLLLGGCQKADAQNPESPGNQQSAQQEEWNNSTGASTAMNSADYWIQQDDKATELRMTEEERIAYNRQVLGTEGASMNDLDAYSDTLDGAQLEKELSYYGDRPDDAYYTGTARITAAQRNEIGENVNIGGIRDRMPTRFGFVLRSTQMRTFPSEIPLYEEPEDVEYDMMVETQLKTWEAFVLLHESKDGEWYYVQTANALGWIHAEDGAVCERALWESLRQQPFLMVLAPRLVMDGAVYEPELSGLVLCMGTALPLAEPAGDVDNATADNCYVVQMPLRNADGTLRTAAARIPKQEEVCQGYLPFTDENLLRQAFKLLGHRYGWGGMFDGWDCSSMVQDIYRTMGIFLPRNSGRQGAVPTQYDVSGKTDEEKMALLQSFRPGALLQMKGHQTLFLGVVDGVAYILHETHGVCAPDGSGDFYNANSTIVSSVLVSKRSGGTFLENYLNFNVVEP